MSNDQHDTGDHRCRRCGDGIHVREDRWFRHDWSEEKPASEIQEALDEDREIEDWFSEGGMFCPSCHADFLTFIGAEEGDDA